MDTETRDAAAAGRLSGRKRVRGAGPLWSKAPLVLLRYPGNLAAIVLGATLLTIAATLFPLFLSRTTSDLVTSGIEDPTLTRYGAGITYRFAPLNVRERAPGSDEPLYQRIDEEFRTLMAESPVLGPPIVGAASGFTQITAADGSTGVFAGRLFTSTDFRHNIRPVGEGGGPGVWLPDFLRSDVKVDPGDEVTIGPPESGIDVRVAGYYRALYTLPRTPYWHPWDDQIYAQRCDRANCPPPPQFLMVDLHDFARLGAAIGFGRDFRWTAPVAEGRELTLDQAHDLDRFANDVRRRVSSGPLEPIFQCCVTPTGFARQTSRLDSGISAVITDVERQVATVRGPGELLEAAGLFVALIVTVTAGIAAGAARRTELELLFVEGNSPGFVAAKTAVESLLPGIAGGAAGLGVAVLLSHVMASGGPIAPSAFVTAAERSGLTVLAAVALLSVVAALSFIRRTEHHRARLAVLGRLPWELILLAIAFFTYRRIQVHGAFTRDPILNVVRPSFAILVFPIVFIAGFGTLGARLLMLGLGWLRDRARRFPSWLYLGVHRLAGGGRLTVLMIAASALCLGIFVQGQTLVRSLRETVDAKAKVFVGSDVGGRIDFRAPYPHDFSLPLTRVTKSPDAGQLQPGGEDFDLLSVDPETLAPAAYWNPAFSGTSLQGMASGLAASSDTAMPVVLVAGGDIDVAAVRIGPDVVPVRVVATSSAFPGMSSLRPTIVASEAAVRELFTFDPLELPSSSTELWVKGDAGRAKRALEALRFRPYPILTANETKDIPYIAAVIDTFVVLNLLGITAALLVIAGILAFLQARQRSQLVSYGLSLRMGMTHVRHRRSMAFELGFVLVASLVVGTIVAFVSASLSVRHLDPFPQIPPPPLLSRPIVAVGIALVVVVAVAWLGAWYANRRARATDFGEVMRLAE